MGVTLARILPCIQVNVHFVQRGKKEMRVYDDLMLSYGENLADIVNETMPTRQPAQCLATFSMNPKPTHARS